MTREKACEGGRTLQDRRAGADFEECVECGTQVRWDLVDHKLFGFQNCPKKLPRRKDLEQL